MTSFLKFQRYLCSNNIPVINSKISKTIQEYSFHYISNFLDLEMQREFYSNIKESKAIIIDKYIGDNQTDIFFIICFHKTLIFINQSLITILQPFFSDHTEIPIYFLSKTKDIFNDHINLDNQKNHFNADSIFLEEIANFNNQLILKSNSYCSSLQPWKYLSSSIAGYLIKQSYSKLIAKQNSIFTNEKNMPINEKCHTEDYIMLRILGIGSSFKVELIYHIETEELFAIKIPNSNNKEIRKLLEREINNYSSFNYPLLPKIYSVIYDKDSNLSYPIIQFINGQNLFNFCNYKFKDDEKLTIIFEIIMIINYLNKNNFIYRDLKPDNLIIDDNKNIFIIDFDRMIKYSDSSENEIHTADLSSPFAAPEIFSGKVSYKSDIYSIGKMIYYIMNDEYLETHENKEKTIFDENNVLKQIYKKCTNENVDQRPTISELMFEFYAFFHSRILNKEIQKDPDVDYFQGIINYKYEYIKKDVNMAIHYFQISASQNDPQSQLNLGIIYEEGNLIKKDVNKAIDYYTLASKSNIAQAQYNLAFIYYEGEYIARDIIKAIHFFTLAADQNYVDAQYNLGVIYYEGTYVKRNMNKAIHYLTLASNQNHVQAQFNLGFFYEKGNYIERDINKAIHFYQLASNQGYSKAQLNLAIIYHKGEFIKQDINKAIHYYSLAAKNNHLQAQYNLGIIYSKGEFVNRDIEKAIQYYSTAANQNHSRAQVNLGIIYYKGEYIKQDINKAMHYLVLASKKNVPQAHLYLGIIYNEGKFVEKDINKAINHFLIAAKHNISQAQSNLGEIFYNKQDINKAIYYFQLAADQNDPQAQLNLALIYDKSEYVKKNINKAIYYYTLAAEQNIVQAQLNLGIKYYKGEYIKRDIEKAIHYFTLAAKQNDPQAQYNLGFIYYDKKFIAQDIDKAIYYFQLAAKQNIPESQNILGLYYIEDIYTQRNINKAIHYFSLAAKQGYSQSQLNLGLIYYNDEKDINKAFHYFSLAAQQKEPIAQIYLGFIFYIKNDINKSFYYFSLAANHNNKEAQYILGLLYINGIYIKKNMIKGIDYLIQSSLNGQIDACFKVGYFYHEGNHVSKDMKKALFYYKEASSFNNQYAKNNLGVIYKNGIGNEIQKNIGLAMSYFEEAIQRSNDKLSMYNLSHIYIYDDKTQEGINKSIDLLIKSSCLYFFNPSFDLLCIAMIKKHGKNLNGIKKELLDKTDQNDIFSSDILKIIEDQQLNDISNFDKKYQCYKEIDFLYDFMLNEILSSQILLKKLNEPKDKMHKNITSDFYDGFGIKI